jgi:site-specific recombinase XerD
MALTSSEVKEIEVIVRKEIRSFMETNTVRQFEEKIMEKILKDMKRGKLEGEVKEIALKMFREFYQFMWMNRSYWEPRLKNA